MNKTERRAVLSSTTDLRVLRESIANDIHRATPDSLKRALESVNLLAQIVHELRTAAKAEPLYMADVMSTPPADARNRMVDLKAAIGRGQDRAFAKYDATRNEDYEYGWSRGYDAGWLRGLVRSADILGIDVSDVVTDNPNLPRSEAK